MKKKGFTLVELLVVIAIIAMLLAILMPALGRVRGLAYRLMCGTNLGGLGKAMSVYSNDYQEMFPVRTGAATVNWNFQNAVSFWDKNIVTDPTFNWATVTDATITSSLYLLIKYADVSTNQFVCKAGNYKKFEVLTTNPGGGQTPSNYTGSGIKDAIDAWDFGGCIGQGQAGPWDYCGYAYQMPYNPENEGSDGPYRVSLAVGTTPSAAALMADASPWFKKGDVNPEILQTISGDTLPVNKPYMPSKQEWGIGGTANKDRIKMANSLNHNQEGQNVLYGDMHVQFESQSNVGVSQDNIYVPWVSKDSDTKSNQEEVQGSKLKVPSGYGLDGSYSSTGNDAFLVN
jgi:prepilin-type N-terminal cleavage/methylation domain-containing protein